MTTWSGGDPAPVSNWSDCDPDPSSDWSQCFGSVYTVTPAASSVPAGTPVTITAQLVDLGGNPIREAGHVVTWSKTGAGGSFASATSITDVNGQAQVAFTVGTTAGEVQTVRGTDEGGRTGVTGNITVAASGADHLVLITGPDATATGDVVLATQPVLHVVDAFGNLVTSSSAAITATPDVGSVTGGVVNAVAGVVTYAALTFVDIPLVKAGNRILTFSGAGLGSAVASAVFVKLGNDMVAWYKDDPDNTLDGSSPPHLLTAYDRTGHGNSLASTGTILRQASLQNAKPGFDFSTAGANYLANLTVGVQGSFTWFGVFKVTAGATYQDLFDVLVVPTTWLFWDQPTNKWQLGDQLAGSAVAGSYVTMVVYYANVAGNVQVTVRVNGAQIFQHNLTSPGSTMFGSPGFPSNQVYPQFRRPPSSFPFTGQLMEYGWYSITKIGSGTETALEAYLRAAYATW